MDEEMNPKEYLALCRKEAPAKMLQDARMFSEMSQKDQNEFLYYLMMDAVNRINVYHQEVSKGLKRRH